MKIKFLSLISIFIFVSSAMTSCLKDNDTVSYPTDATIYSFSMNNIKTTIIRDKDTINFTVDGKDYPFSIDQKNGLIYNPDSLPVNTDVSKTSLNITTAGGLIYYQKNGKNTIWSAADSLDFSKTSFEKSILFTVYSPDLQTSPREYKVWINVHKQYPDSLEWHQIKNTDFPGSTITGKQKAIVLNQTIYVFGQIGNQVKVTSTSTNDGASWKPFASLNGINGNINYSSAIVFDNKIFITADDKVYTSSDGNNWTFVESPKIQTFVNSFTNNPTPSTRLYQEDKRLIGISGNQFIQTSDALNWNITGSIPENFPTNSFATSGAYRVNSNSDIERATVIGTTTAVDTAAVSWTVLSNEKKYIQLSPYANNPHNCPKLDNLSLIYYDGQLYAFGGKGLYNNSIRPFQSFYSSIDNGISWMKVTRNLSFPAEFLYRESNFSYLVDNDNFIWIMWSETGQVWKARVNRLGFIK